MPLRRGTHAYLEAEADRLIKESLAGSTHAQKSDILTPWKQMERQRREIMVPSGAPDAAVRKGVFHRSINPSRPELNSRDGVVRGRRVRQTPDAQSQEPGSFGWDEE